MKKNVWFVALSLSVGLVAGCGQAPATSPAQAGAAGASDFAAQEGVTGTGGDTGTVTGTGEGGGTGTGTGEGTTGGTDVTTGGTMGGGTDVTAGGGTGGGSGGGIGESSVGGVTGANSGDLTGGDSGSFGDSDQMVAFQSSRETGGGGGMDVFIYDDESNTVLALPAVNTAADEVNPRLSSNSDWLIYQTDENGSEDVRLYSLRSQLINTLKVLNTEEFDEVQPDVSDDGNTIVFVSNEPNRREGRAGGSGDDSLRVYDLQNNNNFLVPVATRGLGSISWPTISGNGEVIAYGAAPSDGDNRRVFFYSLQQAAQLTPPFVNAISEDAENYNPDLNQNGDKVVFVSNRRGTEDIYMTDLRSVFTDNLTLANDYTATDNRPRWMGTNGNFTFQSDRAGEFRIFAYNMDNGTLDTLPIANELEQDTQLREEEPSIGDD